MVPLFQDYQLLAERLPYVSLGQLPTPIQKLDEAGEELGLDHLYIKRDDQTAQVYGGNKIRKLEFMLGQSLQTGAQEILNIGFAGSKQALAATVCAKQVGLRSVNMLLQEPSSLYVQRNLLMGHHWGAEIHHYRNMQMLRLGLVRLFAERMLRNGSRPHIIPRRSSPVGTIGYVNAALELKRQIERGEIPEPDQIYVALGTTGTAAGLLLGVKVSRLRSKVVPVRAKSHRYSIMRILARLYEETAAYLNSIDPSFPRQELPADEVQIRDDFFDQGSDLFSERHIRTMKLVEANRGFKFDWTYTGRSFACLMNDAREQNLKDQVILFWNTYNSREYTDAVAAVDYHDLPKGVHKYFEGDVSLLDRPSGGGGGLVRDGE